LDVVHKNPVIETAIYPFLPNKIMTEEGNFYGKVPNHQNIDDMKRV
jgi:hypothetical protein